MRRLLPLALLWTGSCSDAATPASSPEVAGPSESSPAAGATTAVSADAASAPAAPRQCSPARPTAGWRLHTEGTSIVDELGRVAFLRGVNAGGRSKQGPHHMPFDFPPGGFDAALATYLDRASDWGMDVLRVPFMWAAVEPARGADDAAHLAHLDALIDAAWARGIWTVLDFHQDVFAERLCGDGFPSWTLPNPSMAPKAGCALWFGMYQLDADVKAAFDRFWSDTDGIQTAYRELWDRMLARYKDRPGVIGFEPLNEPGWGSALQPVFEATTLRTFFSGMASRINAAVPKALVFVDLPGTDALSLTTTMGRPDGKNVVFAPHYYQAGGLTGAAPVDPAKVANDLTAWRKVGTSWNVPVFVGEFGVPHGQAQTRAFLAAHWSYFDANGLHGAEWEYSDSPLRWNGESLGLLDAASNEHDDVVGALVRVYPRLVAGTGIHFSFDDTSRTFTLDFDATAGGVTEIVVPRRLYAASPGGPRVTVTGACAGPIERGRLLVTAELPGHVRVVVSPR